MAIACLLSFALPVDRLVGQTTTRASVSSAGGQANDHSGDPSISPSGRFVAFDSNATNLVAGDTNGWRDIFLRDRLTGTTTRVNVTSAGGEGNYHALSPSVSTGGAVVAYHSEATNVVAGDTNGVNDVFVRDVLAGATSRVSVSSAGSQGNAESGHPSISADGRFVAFQSDATNLVVGDSNGHSDVFVHDRLTAATSRVSLTSTGGQALGGGSGAPSISADGRFVTFQSDATNLVPGDTNGYRDIFVHDRLTGATTRVSVSTTGAQANYHTIAPAISANGRYVVFRSDATTLVVGDTNGYRDVFVHDRLTGATQLASVNSTGGQGNSGSGGSAISADGRFVGFKSSASNLVPGDTNGVIDAFVKDLVTGAITRVSVDSRGKQGNHDSGSKLSISASGRFATFQSRATNLVLGDTNDHRDVFVHDSIELAFNGIASSPNPVNFTVSNALGETGNLAWVLLSCTGTAGAPLPGGRTVPLTFDGCTMVSLGHPGLFAAMIANTGTATTSGFPFPPMPPGFKIYCSAVTIDPLAPSVVVSITGPIAFDSQ